MTFIAALYLAGATATGVINTGIAYQCVKQRLPIRRGTMVFCVLTMSLFWPVHMGVVIARVCSDRR